MRRLILASLIAAVVPMSVGAPAIAQSRSDEARFDAAQARFDREWSIYQQELQRYRSARGYRGQQGSYRDDGGPDYQSGGPGYQSGGYSDDRDEGSYDPSRYYRSGPNYQQRTLAADDRVYRGSDGRYYCRRNDGTTGLIVGGVGGAVLGNVIDGGHSRTVGTLIGGAIGALAGKSIDQNRQSVQCR